MPASTFDFFIQLVQPAFRKRRAALFLDQFPNFRNLRVLDLGGSQRYWRALAHIKPHDLTALNLEGSAESQKADGAGIVIQTYDGERIPYGDKHFDVVVSNSVIEHVPPQSRARFVAEIQRVAQYAFIQTPAFAFPIEPHFLVPFMHWLPRSLGRRLVSISPMRFLGSRSRKSRECYFNSTQLLTLREFQSYLPNFRVHTERFLGLPKSYTLYGPLSAISSPTTC